MMSRIMKLKSLQVVVIVLIISFLIPVELPAKDKKKGAELVVFKAEGATIEGELLAVKENTLILMTSGSLEEKVSIDAVNEIRVKRKNKFLKTFLIGGIAGFATGALLGGIMGASFNGEDGLYVGNGAVLFGAIGTLPGLLVGGIASGFISDYKRIKVKQTNNEERMMELLTYLNKKARYEN